MTRIEDAIIYFLIGTIIGSFATNFKDKKELIRTQQYVENCNMVYEATQKVLIEELKNKWRLNDRRKT